MKKVIALILVAILFFTAQEEMLAVEKQGIQIYVHFKNGKSIKGELICVKQDGLLVLDPTTGGGRSIAMSEVKAIDIARKAQVGLGMLLGTLSAIVIGSVIEGPFHDKRTSGWFGGEPGVYTAAEQRRDALLPYGVGGFGVGALIGVACGIDKRFKIDGRSEHEVREVLEKLRKKARVPDYK